MVNKFQKFQQYFFQPVDAASLALFRILFGLVTAFYVFTEQSPAAIHYKFILPQFFFPYPLFAILHLPFFTGNDIYKLFRMMGVCACTIGLGIFYRISLILFFFSFGYIFLLEKSYYNDYGYLILLITFLLFFMGAHRSASFDIFRQPKLNTRRVPWWNIFILRAQISIVYFYSGLVKLSPDYLSGSVLRLMLAGKTPYPFIGHFFQQDGVILFLTYFGLLFDLTIGFLLWYNRPRVWVFSIAILVHLMNKLFFGAGVFHYLMIAALVLFLKPEEVRQFFNKFRGIFRFPLSTVAYEGLAEAGERRNKGREKIILSFLACYLLWQVLFPLRPYFYLSDIDGTLGDSEFSWRMEASGVNSPVEIFARDPKTNKTIKVKLSRYLNDQQIRAMSYRPEMVERFVKYLKRVYVKRGIKNPQVYVTN